MNPAMVTGMIGGIAEATHQRNLLDLQNTVSGNTLMMQHLLGLSNDTSVPPEAQQIALQGAMDMSSGLSKDQSGAMGKTLGAMAQAALRAQQQGFAAPGAGGPQQLPQPTPPTPAPAPTRPPIGGLPPGGGVRTPSPTPAGVPASAAMYNPQAQGLAPGVGVMAQPETPAPVSPAGAGATYYPPAAPPPAPPPEPILPQGAATTPSSSATPTPTIPAAFAGVPPTTGGFRYSPETQANMAAHAMYMQYAAQAAATDPYKIREIEAKNELTRITAQLRFEGEALKNGYKTTYDINGYPHWEPMQPGEQSALQQSIVAKNQAAGRLADARQTQATAEAEYKRGLLDPKSPVNMQRLAQIEALRARISAEQTRLGISEFTTHARYYGTDLDGNPLPGAIWDPSIGKYVGTAFQSYYAPTAATRRTGEAAQGAIKLGNELIKFANDPANVDLFGAINGRWSDWSRYVGTDDARKLELQAAIESFAAVIATSHGWRSAEAPQKFADLMNQKASPKAFAGGVYQLIDAAQILRDVAKPNTGPNAKDTGGGGGGGGGGGANLKTVTRAQLDAYLARARQTNPNVTEQQAIDAFTKQGFTVEGAKK